MMRVCGHKVAFATERFWQIAVLAAAGVIVVVQGQHLCMAMRGIRKPGSITVTSAVRGVFKTDAPARDEA